MTRLNTIARCAGRWQHYICVLIMPSMRLRKGETAVRLGRIVH